MPNARSRSTTRRSDRSPTPRPAPAAHRRGGGRRVGRHVRPTHGRLHRRPTRRVRELGRVRRAAVRQMEKGPRARSRADLRRRALVLRTLARLPAQRVHVTAGASRRRDRPKDQRRRRVAVASGGGGGQAQAEAGARQGVSRTEEGEAGGGAAGGANRRGAPAGLPAASQEGTEGAQAGGG